MNIKILQPSSLLGKEMRELNILLCELHPRSKTPTALYWRRVLKQKDIQLFAVQENGILVGMAILRWHDLPVGRVGTVEDVVVTQKYRGKGHGERLIAEVISFAKKKKMAYIDLTSRPERVAANKLYQKMGWKKRETNAYRLTVTPSDSPLH